MANPTLPIKPPQSPMSLDPKSKAATGSVTQNQIIGLVLLILGLAMLGYAILTW